jgi:hypothetical protein
MAKTNERELAHLMGLTVAAVREYRSKGAPLESPDAFFKWFIDHHRRKGIDHAPQKLAA